MLFPALSVTLIGLAVGGGVAARVGHPARPLAYAIIGAWLGFLAGAILGFAVDAAVGSGVWVAIIGHVAAVVGAVTATRRRFSL